MRIRRASAADTDAVVAVERAAEHAPHWQREVYAEMVRAEGAEQDLLRRCLILAEGGDGQIVGFAAGQFYLDSAALESVCVAAAARRAGVGRALCGAVFEWGRCLGAAEIGLEVRAGNRAAIALYTGLGFLEAGRRRGYYANPVEDAVLLRLCLTGS